MPTFEDGFNRPNGPVGNNWKFKAKLEGQAANGWHIVDNVVHEDINQTTLMFRANPVAVGANHVAKAHFRQLNRGEIFVRFNGTGGQGGKRISVVVNGPNGKLVAVNNQVETSLATWTRVDDTDFHLHVFATRDTITVFDSNHVNGLTVKCAEVTNYTTYNQSTGVGVGWGRVEHFRLEDITGYTITPFELAPVRVSVGADVKVSFADASAPDTPRSEQRRASLSVAPYSVIEGIPQGGLNSARTRTGLTFGAPTITDNGQPTDPKTVAVSATHRYLPVDIAHGSSPWFRVGGGAAPYWNVQRNGTTDPNPNGSYIYSSPLGSFNRRVFSFNRKGYLQLANYPEPTGNPVPLTYAVAGVFHGGRGPHYGILQTDRSTYAPGGAAMSLRYAHGRFELWANGLVASYEGKGGVTSPTIIVVSLDPATNRGRILIQDRRRFARQFALRNINSFSPAMFMGGAMSNIDEFNELVAADMDIFEIGLWNSALSMYDMQRYVNAIAPLYGVTL